MNPEVERILSTHREAIASLCSRYAVVRLRIFGSAVEGGWDHTRSDLDFIAEYGPGRDSLSPLRALVGLQDELENLLNRKVDVVDWNAARNPFFRRHAEGTAKEIYAA